VLDLFAYSLHQSHVFLFLGKAETARPTKATFELVNKRWKHIPLYGWSTRFSGTRRKCSHGECHSFLARIAPPSHPVRGMPYQEVRRAIDTCFREHTTMTLPELELDQSSEGSGRYVTFTIMIMQVEQGAPELATITALDVTEQVQLKKRFEAVQREHTELVGELSATNKRFGTMNKELQDANEELQAANEELMLTQEELQATNEEFEATNEELQATNEELETNNEELQATNEELQTTNHELTARTIELQELTKQYRVEQLQLSILLERFPHYVMVLDAEKLTIQAINPAYKQLVGNRDVQGLPLTELLNGPEVSDLMTAINTAISEAQSKTIGQFWRA
jgi:PAS domain-containing protein